MLESSTNHGNKIFRIFGLFCMIALSINQSIIIPVGLVILLLLIAFKTSYQEAFKSNIKKSVIAILIGLLLAFGGMGFVIDINKTSENQSISFNFQLLPSRYIDPIVGLFIDEDKIRKKFQDNLESDPKIAECMKLTESFLMNYNDQEYIKTVPLRHSEFSEEDVKSITEKLPSFYNSAGSIDNLKILRANTSNVPIEGFDSTVDVTKLEYENNEMNVTILCGLDKFVNKQKLINFDAQYKQH